jgi:hypothetical protein
MIGKSIALAGIIFTIATAAASAEQVAATTTAGNTVPLPEVVVHAPQPQNPYTGAYPRQPSSANLPAPHFAVPAGYDTDRSMVPYTNGLGLCIDGSAPSGCTRAAPSRYEQGPFNQ